MFLSRFGAWLIQCPVGRLFVLLVTTALFFFSRNSHRDTFKCATTPTTPPPSRPRPPSNTHSRAPSRGLRASLQMSNTRVVVRKMYLFSLATLLVTCLLQVMVLGVVLQAWAYSWSYEKSYILKVCVNWTPFYSRALYLVFCWSLLCTIWKFSPQTNQTLCDNSNMSLIPTPDYYIIT